MSLGYHADVAWYIIAARTAPSRFVGTQQRCAQSDGTQFFYHYPLFGEFCSCHVVNKGISGFELICKIFIPQHILEVDLQELLAFSLISRWRGRGSLEEMEPASFFVCVQYSRTGPAQV